MVVSTFIIAGSVVIIFSIGVITVAVSFDVIDTNTGDTTVYGTISMTPIGAAVPVVSVVSLNIDFFADASSTVASVPFGAITISYTIR